MTSMSVRFLPSLAFAFLLALLATPLHAQIVVSSSADLPDSNATDGIASPPTLRAAIEHANLSPGPHVIEVSDLINGDTVMLTDSLPPLGSQIRIEGNSLTVSGRLMGNYSQKPAMLTIREDSCVLRELRLIASPFGHALVLEGDGTLVEGSAFLDNERCGILILSNDNVVRTSHLSGNDAAGIEVSTTKPTNTLITDCKLGTTIDGMRPHGNEVGIALGICDSTRIIGNVVASNTVGVLMSSAATRVGLISNTIGLDAVRKLELGNSVGVRASCNDCVIQHNYISGNGLEGIWISGGRVIVDGNVIGLPETGNVSAGNGRGGIRIEGGGRHAIGGPPALRGNVISDNDGGAIILGGSTFGPFSADSILIQNNYIGTDASGTIAKGNDGHGILIERGASHAVIKGNLISANSNDGIRVGATGDTSISRSDTITANFIGTDITGMIALPNGGHGVEITNGVEVCVGLGEDGNLISGNQGAGIVINGERSQSVQVSANLIGVGIDGSTPLENQRGVWISGGRSHLVGDGWIGRLNVIAHNQEAGVRITDDVLNIRVSGNSIFENGGLGIDLGTSGPDHIDPLDPDEGANTFINAPILWSAFDSADFQNIEGEYFGKPNTFYDIEFYNSPRADPSGLGEGATYRGTLVIKTDEAGYYQISTHFRPSPDSVYTAFATDRDSNTSEFSNAVKVADRRTNTDVSIDITGDSVASLGKPYTYTITITNHGPGVASPVMFADTIPQSMSITSVRSTRGILRDSAGVLTARLGMLDEGDSAVITIDVVPLSLGSITNRAHAINGFGTDLAPTSNIDTHIVNVSVAGVSKHRLSHSVARIVYDEAGSPVIECNDRDVHTLEIYDVKGVLLQRSAISNGRFELSRRSLSAGRYTVRVLGHRFIESLPLVIVK